MTEPDETAGDVLRIRRTWAKAAGAGDFVGGLFYRRLFEIAPEAQRLFRSDMGEQSRKLMQTLNWIVDHLDHPSDLNDAATALALRHVRYGVAAGNYGAVGQALIDTLDAALGADFTPEDAAAWGRVYGGLSGMMIDAAYSDANPVQ